jgi:hypothetical protein
MAAGYPSAWRGNRRAVIALELPLDPDAPAKARAALEPLRGSLPRQEFGDLRLLVTELIVDDLRADQSADRAPIRLRTVVRDETLRLELVEGWTATSGTLERPEPGDLGWGLYLADVLADRWGLEDAGPDTVLWVEKRIGVGRD